MADKPTPTERVALLTDRWNDLKSKRSPWFSQWQDLSDYILPFAGRFNRTDHGQNRNIDYLINVEATQDLHLLASGLMSGSSSPARPWFRIQPKNEELRENWDVRLWCDEVQRILLKIFAVSNTYARLHKIYRDLGLFGISADIIIEDYNSVISHVPIDVGEFCCEVNPRTQEIDTLYREYELTTAQAVKFYGYENLSQTIQTAYDRGQLGTYWGFLHAIEPREDRTGWGAKGMPYASYVVELESAGTKNHTLVSESGFYEFPCIVPRWDVLGNDAYGFSPCMTILPAVMQLQEMSLRQQQVIDNMTRPPVQAPTTARQTGFSLSSGAVNYTTSTDPSQRIVPIITTQGDLTALNAAIQEIKADIRRGTFADLFLMVQNTAGDRRTTVEIYALQQEQMTALGPVVERVQTECLGRLVQVTYNTAFRAGVLPPPPPEIQNLSLDVEFESLLAQSQKAVDVNVMDRFFSGIGGMAQIMPDILDRVNPDGTFDEYMSRLGVSPKLARSVEEADEIRQQRAQAQAQAEQMQAENLQAQTAAEQATAQKLGAEASGALAELAPVAGGSVM